MSRPVHPDYAESLGVKLTQVQIFIDGPYPGCLIGWDVGFKAWLGRFDSDGILRWRPVLQRFEATNGTEPQT